MSNLSVSLEFRPVSSHTYMYTGVVNYSGTSRYQAPNQLLVRSQIVAQPVHCKDSMNNASSQFAARVLNAVQHGADTVCGIADHLLGDDDSQDYERFCRKVTRSCLDLETADLVELDRDCGEVYLVE